jgi:hypothetical protein
MGELVIENLATIRLNVAAPSSSETPQTTGEVE